MFSDCVVVYFTTFNSKPSVLNNSINVYNFINHDQVTFIWIRKWLLESRKCSKVLSASSTLKIGTFLARINFVQNFRTTNVGKQACVGERFCCRHTRLRDKMNDNLWVEEMISVKNYGKYLENFETPLKSNKRWKATLLRHDDDDVNEQENELIRSYIN